MISEPGISQRNNKTIKTQIIIMSLHKGNLFNDKNIRKIAGGGQGEGNILPD